MKRLDLGGSLQIEKGGFNGEQVVLSNLVPHRYSPELEMRYANFRAPDLPGNGHDTIL